MIPIYIPTIYIYIYIYLYVSDGHSNDVIYHIPIYHHISYTQKIFQLKLPPVSPVERSPCRDQEITSTPKRHGPPPGSSPATPTRPTLRRTTISHDFTYDFPTIFPMISLKNHHGWLYVSRTKAAREMKVPPRRGRRLKSISCSSSMGILIVCNDITHRIHV